MTALLNVLSAGALVAHHRPWLRAVVEAPLWQTLAADLAAGRWTLLSLWGAADGVHLALLDEAAGTVAVATHPCADGVYPSVGRLHPPAQRLEQAARDLFGLTAEDAPDARPWLDHGRWGLSHPLAAGGPGPAHGAPYTFLPAEGEGLHQVAVGPVHAGIIEPGHFRFTANGEAVVRLEERLGYVHRGLEGLMAGASVARSAALAGRASGDSTVAYALAFARAVEAALGLEVPVRALWLRGVMAELERLANHFGDIGAICNDAAFPRLLASCAVLREQVLRAARIAFGHRLMMDGVIPGGVARAATPEGIDAIRAVVATAGSALPGLMTLYDGTASLQDRTVGTGRAHPDLVRRFGCGGVVGRASGRAFDVRRTLPYPPYDQLSFDVPVLNEGDVNARVWIRFREVEQSLALVTQMLDRMPADGPLAVATGARTKEPSEGLALVEGFRGDVLAFVRLDGAGRIACCHLRDPSWFHWPVLEAAIDGNIIADFPLINKSFNGSYAGHDL